MGKGSPHSDREGSFLLGERETSHVLDRRHTIGVGYHGAPQSTNPIPIILRLKASFEAVWPASFRSLARCKGLGHQREENLGGVTYGPRYTESGIWRRPSKPTSERIAGWDWAAEPGTLNIECWMSTGECSLGGYCRGAQCFMARSVNASLTDTVEERSVSRQDSLTKDGSRSRFLPTLHASALPLCHVQRSWAVVCLHVDCSV